MHLSRSKFPFWLSLRLRYDETRSLNDITIQVMLSRLRLKAQSLRISSTTMPATLFVSRSSYCFTVAHARLIIFTFDSLSKIPSQPSKIKSLLSLILNSMISGVAMTTLGLPPNLFYLCFNISKGPGYRQPTWLYSRRTKHHLWDRRPLPSPAWNRICSLCLVDLPTIWHYPLDLILICWFVVVWKSEDLITHISWHNRSAVSDISDVSPLFNYESYDGSASRSVKVFHQQIFIWGLALPDPSLFLRFFSTILQEVIFCISEASHNCLRRIRWEVFITNDEQVQVVPEIIWSIRPAMTIKDAKESSSWPFNILPISWFFDIQNNRHTILVIVPWNPLVGRSCIAIDYPILPGRSLRMFIIR